MRGHLLALSGCRAASIGSLSHADWQELDTLADGHRLRPHLHGRLSRGELPDGVPSQIIDTWRKAHRANAITVLLQRRALVQAEAILRGHQIDLVALKGAALAWSAWPAPAERVMRDIDILVPLHQAATAYDLLREAGWQAPAMTPEAAKMMAAEETHLPPLYSPEGVMCELHGHAWSSAPVGGLTMPACDDGGIFERARRDEDLGCSVPSPEDMLGHLVVHCASSHLFNIGPLALADIDYLTQEAAIDWSAFWLQAHDLRFERSAALVLALTDKWRQPGLLETSGCSIAVDEVVIERAEQLLEQDPANRKDINAIAGLALGTAASRIRQHPLDAAEAPQGPGARLRSLGSRGMSLAGSMLDKRTRSDGIAAAHIAQWLQTD